MEHVVLSGKRCAARWSVPSQQDKTSEWMRSLSERLWSSYHGSAQIRNRVVKGRSRETQVLDIFEGLLQKGVVLERDVVIIDSKETEAPDFDGVIYDRMRFPVLYFEESHNGETNNSVLLESVLLCFETKSNLNKDELDDTVQKIRRLHSLQSVSGSTRPPVLLFAYEAKNINLSFVDYCAVFASDPSNAPNLICVLNKGVFMAAKKLNTCAVPSPKIEHGSYPVFAHCGNEALLLTYFLVSRLCAGSSEVIEILEAYVQNALKEVSLFSFPTEFVSKLSEQSFHSQVRQRFFGTAKKPIVEVYKSLNLR